MRQGRKFRYFIIITIIMSWAHHPPGAVPLKAQAGAGWLASQKPPLAVANRLPFAGSFEQFANALLQQFDGPVQGSELSSADDRDGHVQVK